MKTLIIGGSSGIGLATAQLAAKQEHKVIIASRSKEKLIAAQKLITGNVVNHVIDTRDDKSIVTLFEEIGQIDNLVITGSEVSYGNIGTTAIAEAKQSFDSKFFGPYRVIKAGLPYLSTQGTITLFSGSAGTKSEKGTEILSAINSAVDAFARALAISLAPIRVNSIAPGIIDTPVYDGIDADTQKLFTQFTQSLLVKRMGKAEEVAQAVLYLINNRYVTGTIIYVDGGHVV